MEGDEERIEVKGDLPSPAAISILQFHTRKKKKKNLVTDNPSFCDCLTMNY